MAPSESDEILGKHNVERDHILAAVESAGENRTRAAADLGIGLAMLERKLKRYSAAVTTPGVR